jgi:phenylalanyl-tRNA synthetase beta chain
MDITTNRVDAMNHYGVAREAAAIYGLKLPALRLSLPEAARRRQALLGAHRGRGRLRPVHGAGAARHHHRRLAGLVRGRGGGHLLRLLEQKQISNAVDATNFAWLAMGQPTHAFDLDKIEGGIVVRRARKGRAAEDAGRRGARARSRRSGRCRSRQGAGLAGVMGGWDTMITPETKNVLVEAAWFDPMAVRRTARRHGLHTDASHRFERGADFNAAPVASALVSSILLANGGWIEGELVDVRVPAHRSAHRQPQAHRARAERGASHSGRDGRREGITAATVEGVLTALGCGLASQQGQKSGQAAWLVTLPSWRLDLEREIDLIEEVARVYGYNRFANTLPPLAKACARCRGRKRSRSAAHAAGRRLP